jgi:hypothetical protein
MCEGKPTRLLSLGARPGEILRVVFGQGVLVVVPGTAIGILAAFAIARLVGGFLVGVSPTDPITYAGVSIMLTFVALDASYIPARRPTKVDPMVALRHESGPQLLGIAEYYDGSPSHRRRPGGISECRQDAGVTGSVTIICNPRWVDSKEIWRPKRAR